MANQYVFGGLGMGSAFPTRPNGTPQSNVVQSGEEFNNEWGAKLDGLRKSAGVYNLEQEALRVSGNSFASRYPGATDKLADPDLAKRYLADSQTFTTDNSAFGQDAYQALDAYRQAAMQNGVGGDLSWAPAALAQTEAQYTAAGQQRDSNNIRQQQAFDTTMMGNGAIGGVMPSDYSSPTYGQITSQAPTTGGFGLGGGSSDLTGVDTAQQTGAYLGGAGAYNPSPWSVGNFKGSGGWSGF